MDVQNEMKDIGSRIRKTRKSQGMTMKELGKKIDLSESMIWRYEKGDLKSMNVNVVRKIAKALGVNPEDILGWEDSETDKIYRKLEDEKRLSPIVTETSRKIPVLGDIACGSPIIANREYDEYIDLSETIKGDFALRAKGDSMIGARIYNGDLVICQKREEVENGEIAVVLLDGEVTLKRFYWYPVPEVAILKPENPDYPDIQISEGDFSNVVILGKAITTIRNLK